MLIGGVFNDSAADMIERVTHTSLLLNKQVLARTLILTVR